MSRRLPQEKVDAILRCREAGMTYDQTADAVGIGRTTVCNYLNRLKPANAGERFDGDTLRRAIEHRFGSLTAGASARNVGHTHIAQVCAGTLDLYAADRWAVRFGFHPCEIWPAWFQFNDEIGDETDAA